MTSPRPTLPSAPRILPVEDPSPEVAAILFSPRRGVALNVSRTLANSPALFQQFRPLGMYLASEGLIPARERELVILRMGWRAQSIYEFGQLTVFALRGALSEEEIGGVTLDLEAWPWTDDERDLLTMTDELFDHDCVSEATWQRLASRWSPAELIELLVLAGYYRTVSGLLNSVGVVLDDGVPGWPVAAPPR